MTREEILNMEAGQEMDNLVAEKVMGWHLQTDKDGWRYWANESGEYQHAASKYDGYEDDEDLNLIFWHPSESIMWAWEVANAETFFTLDVILARGLNYWEVNIAGNTAIAEDVPLAICRAALLFMAE